MKIDIHVHTKKTKQGDAETREIDAKRFHEIVSSTEVKVVAITNHNVFDFEQYKEFYGVVGSDFQMWPGVELDVFEDDRRGHLIVITSPEKAHDLEKTIKAVSGEMTPDNFKISLEDVISHFDKLNPIYIAHYKQKKPDLIDDDIDYLIANTANENRVLKEATNSVSAGIFISHGHASIYGSDVQNWEKYQYFSQNLPDLRLPVESFEQFCLLLDKNQKAIDTLLDKKSPEKITIIPFKDGLPLELTVYDDINVFFGAKGTGKSEILAAIERHYSSKGIECKKFESGADKLEDVYDVAGKKLQIDLNDHNIDYCLKEIELLKNIGETSITTLSKYRFFFAGDLKNKKAKRIKIRDYSPVTIQHFERDFEKLNEAYFKVDDFIDFVEGNEIVKEILEDNKLESLISILQELESGLDKRCFEKFAEGKAAALFNNIIEVFKEEISRKTDSYKKPSITGFREYASNRIKIEVAVNKILENMAKTIYIPQEYVGNLDDKGELFCKTEITIRDGSASGSSFKPISSVKKNTQKFFANQIKEIKDNVYSEDLFNVIAKFKDEEDISTIPTILELLVFNRYFTIDGEEYEPSTGEASMILLHRELSKDRDIYILDEPEKSLGNEYINNVIVPLIKDKAKYGKKIFIATHDANLAVRTLPYNSIYRYHDRHGYSTYVGNPFSNNLVGVSGGGEKIDWKDVSMRTLEGGKDAFGERGQIYGNP